MLLSRSEILSVVISYVFFGFLFENTTSANAKMSTPNTLFLLRNINLCLVFTYFFTDIESRVLIFSLKQVGIFNEYETCRANSFS